MSRCIPCPWSTHVTTATLGPRARLSLSSTAAPPRLRPLHRPRSRPRIPVETLEHARYVSDVQQFRTRHGNVKLNLKAKGAVGIAQSRGERAYQEDAYLVSSVSIPVAALKRNVVTDRLGAGWNPTELEGFEGEVPSTAAEEGEGEVEVEARQERRLEGTRTGEEPETLRQVAMFGVFDGHGGSQVSKFLRSRLSSLVEQATSSSIPRTIDSYRQLGGYLKRYQGGPLERFREGSDVYQPGVLGRGMALDEMSVLAFLQADNAVLADDKTNNSGSTATVAFLHSLDLPHSLPYYASSLLSLTIAHLGDTSLVLASSGSGRARRLTEPHHGDSRVEGERLRTSGTGIVTDSFGETRWGGTLANTRGIGDREFKSLGVIGEPEVSKRVLKGEDWSFLVLASDGITDVMSDQEIVDLTRGHKDPNVAAKKIVGFAEDVGGEDNMTCLVVPLPGWAKMGGMDTTADRREYRLRQFNSSSRRQKRM
ncbi:hypothetical protein JCM10212_004497 [Sporobolomyces blumeae]